ncbi:MAG: TlyA family RNA methyltransferase [Paracoccaceae bacterium]
MSTDPAATRLDQRLVSLGLAETRTRAQALISAGVVTVDGAVRRKAADRVSGTVEITHDPCPWVSRAALKLGHALDAFDLMPKGIAADIGASTGGFTEVLMARGASEVHAIDVGHGQIHPRVAALPGVHVHEGINARDLPDGVLPPLDWIVCDVSFISLPTALPPVLAPAKPGAHLIALIKPQFEAGPGKVGKGGIVTDPEMHERVRAQIAEFLTKAGWQTLGEVESPITGGDGNREFLIAAQRLTQG